MAREPQRSHRVAPWALWVKPQEGGEGAGTEGARVFWGHRSGHVGHPNFRMCDPAQRSPGSSHCLLRLGLGSEGPGRRAPGAPSRRLPGLHRPGAAQAAAVVGAGTGRRLPMGWLRGLPAGGQGLVPPRSVLSALALCLPRGRGGALGPQVGGVGLRDLQYAAHGADRPHQLLGRGRGLRHGTRRLRAAPRGGPGRG